MKISVFLLVAGMLALVKSCIRELCYGDEACQCLSEGRYTGSLYLPIPCHTGVFPRRSDKDCALLLVRAGFPIYDQFGYQKKPIVGYRGAELLLYDIANATLDYQYQGDRT